MVIVDVKLAFDTGGDGDTGPWYTSIYKVQFTGTWSAAALNTAGGSLPLHLSGRTDDIRVYASDIKVTLDPDESFDESLTTKKQAIYTVDYKMRSLTYDINPLNRPAEIEWGGSDQQNFSNYDITGAPIVNSAQDFYDSIPGQPVRGGELTITKNEQSNPYNKCINYSYTCNSDQWYLVAPGIGLIGKISARKIYESVSTNLSPTGFMTYWQVQYPIKLKRDGWNFKPISAGWNQYTDAGPKMPILNPTTMQSYSVVQPLDRNGRALDTTGPWVPVIFPTNGYKMIENAAWATLSLPNPFLP
jgi:hypothetical protein